MGCRGGGEGDREEREREGHERPEGREETGGAGSLARRRRHAERIASGASWYSLRVPILKREPDFLPAELFDLAPERYPWWVAHVRSRQEKVLARECGARNIPFYLPLREHRSRRDPRHRISFLPLFPGYLFVRGDAEHERLDLLKTNLCVNVLQVLDQEGLAHDLAQVRRLQETGLPLQAHPDLAKGSVVRIAEGPFEGMTGCVTSLKGKNRFVVSVRFIHRSVSVELDRDELEPERTSQRSGR